MLVEKPAQLVQESGGSATKEEYEWHERREMLYVLGDGERMHPRNGCPRGSVSE